MWNVYLNYLVRKFDEYNNNEIALEYHKMYSLRSLYHYLNINFKQIRLEHTCWEKNESHVLITE